MQASGLTEITLLLYILTIYGQYPLFLYPEFPLGHTRVGDGDCCSD